MQAELEKWVEDNSELGADGKSWVIPEKAVRALLAGKVLCDQQSIAAISTSSEEVVATLDAAYFGTNWTPLYAPASLAGNADVGTMRIVAIQGAAEDYARQGNAVIDNQLWDKFGKEGRE
jgi:hypothetical protein